MPKNYYEVLGVLPTADDVVIKAAYKVLAQRYHPDKYKGNAEEASLRMAEINVAYATLSDPFKRKQYDDKCRYEKSQEDLRQSAKKEADSNKYTSATKNGGGSNRDAIYCVDCKCLITGNSYKSMEEVQVGRSSNIGRTGLFNFNLNEMWFSNRKYFANTWVYYCENCWRKKRQLKKISIVLILLLLLFFIIWIFITVRNESNNVAITPQKTPRKSEIVISETSSAITPKIYLIKLGAFTTAERVELWSSRLNELGIPNYIQQKNNADGSSLFVLQAGPYSERDTAEEAEMKIRNLGMNPRIVHVDAGSNLHPQDNSMDGEASATASSQRSLSPSFDCSGSLNNIERLICSNSVLAKLDVELSQVYFRAYNASLDKGAMKTQQIQWIKTTRLCASVECVEKSYRDRIRYLSQ